jgi:hypothetical protein
VVLDERAVCCRRKKLCSVDERSCAVFDENIVCCSKKELCGVQQKTRTIISTLCVFSHLTAAKP